MHNKLIFIGTGGAFSKKNINNSAYIKKNNHIILFDCGETVFHQILKTGIIDQYTSRIDIIITHFYSDYVGSIGSLLFYCRFKKIKSINVIFPKKDVVVNYLKIIGISYDMYKFIYPKNLDYYLRPYVQEHGDIDSNKNIILMPAYGYHLKFYQYNIFYSGDTNVLNPDVLNKFKQGRIKYIYHDVSLPQIDGFKTHIELNELEKLIDKEIRSRFYLMHLPDNFENSGKKLGFKEVS